MAWRTVKASKVARGYGVEHRNVRKQWQPIVDRGEAFCHAVRCLEPSRQIPPGTPWDLGHTPDRKTWTGPEHPRCNRSDGGRRARAKQKARTTTWKPQRNW